MNEIKIKKQELRNRYKQIRNNIPDKVKKAKIITKRVIENADYKNAKIIALYKSFGSEIDTDEIIEHSINIGKTVVLPKVVGDELKFYKIKSLNDDLVTSKLGISEPINDATNYIENKEIDLYIVPGLCFDKKNNRLGYGGGFYDRTLKDSKAKTFAICYKEQILKNEMLPVLDTDIKVQKIITD